MDWTSQDAREWAKTWASPTMKKGLKYIARRVRPKKSNVQVAQGFDLSPVFIKSAGYYEGAQEVMDIIETLGEGEITKPNLEMPQPYGHILSEEATNQ